MSLRMRRRTEMESRMVILKPSFSPLVWLMKKEARSRSRNKTMCHFHSFHHGATLVAGEGQLLSKSEVLWRSNFIVL